MYLQKFFAPCSIHHDAKKNEKNICCLDCCTSICPHCVLAHRSHCLLQIRRYVYHEVVRLEDLEKLMHGLLQYPVQAYTINAAKVLFIKKRPQNRQFKGSGNDCTSCDRSLQEPFIHCSLVCNCKVAIVVSHAALPSEEYWNSVLPNTLMPKAVKDLLQPTLDGRETAGTRYKEKMMVYGMIPWASPFQYAYGGTGTQLHDDPNVALFFLERDLYAGNKMNLHFSKPKNEETFLPHHTVDSIPFSSSMLPEIYRKFSVNPGSKEAEAIKKTIRECEDTGLKGEEKLCATSLESMIDFSTSVLGKEVDAVSTRADSARKETYRVEAVRRMPSEKPVVVCHQQEYVYAVFYCHTIDNTVAYGVSLVGPGGTKAEAVAVCHRNTAEWNPKHVAFQVLKVKPGAVPICHYLPENHIVWVAKI